VLPFILFTINWQIAMPSIGRSSLFCSRKSVGYRNYFHSAIECLELFFEILKNESCFFLHKISKAEATKQVLAALTAGLFTQMDWEYAGKAMFFDKSATKVLFLNLICNGIQMILTVILVLVCCILMPNSM
jgi:thiamine transporter ThiT